MSWAEIKKAVNSDLDVPLNELIDKKIPNYSDVLLNTTFSIGGSTTTVTSYTATVSSDCQVYISLYKGVAVSSSMYCTIDIYVNDIILTHQWYFQSGSSGTSSTVGNTFIPFRLRSGDIIKITSYSGSTSQTMSGRISAFALS